MSASSEISHTGTVKSIEGNVATIEIQVSSACATCKATSFCGSSESGSRTIEAHIGSDQNVSVGDDVRVLMTQVMGTKAIVIGYVIPSVVVLVGLFVLIGVGVNEGIAALVSLVLLTAYYVVLYLLRDRIKKVFNFRIEKL
ncbi:MAG: SoxR reducing system RseC family protein [Bacteroidales bacterium]|nr:SoxR reducing system RseC family protein [Bacteroidales bacterium]